MTADRDSRERVKVRHFSAVDLDGRYVPGEDVAPMIARSELDLEDEWWDEFEQSWRALWNMHGIDRPAHWDAMQRQHGPALRERRRRVISGEFTRGAYLDFRRRQLQLVATEGATTVTEVARDPRPARDSMAEGVFEDLPAHIRGPYQPVRELGRGGSGRVYLVRHRHSEALFAIKLTRAGLGVEAVLNELRALERVKSPHVVSVRHYEAIDDGEDGRWLIVSEHVDGPTLQQYRLDCPERRVSDPVVLRDLLLGIARGLADLHRHGVVHRDLKPANVILRGGVVPGVAPMPVIIDLGMSRGTGGMTLLGGTPGYQSPEQEAGERCTPASDVFVFGLVAYELATGRRLTGARLQLLHEVCPGLPPVLDELVKERCASDEVSERLADGAALLAALEAAFRQKPSAARSSRTSLREPTAPSAVEGDRTPLPIGFAWRLNSPTDAGEFQALCQRADRGDAQAMFEVAKRYERGHGIAQSHWWAHHWYARAAERGYVIAMFNVAVYLITGQAGMKDQPEALNWLQVAAERGHTGSMVELGKRLRDGNGVDRDRWAAVGHFERAAKEGNLAAMHELGCCLRDGVGCQRNRPRAAKWFRRAAEAGHAQSMTSLGDCLLDGVGVEANIPDALEWFKRAVCFGLPSAMEGMGRCLHLRAAGPQDDTDASEWFRRGAEANRASCARLYAECFERGRGVARSLPEALEWYRRAASAGDAEAMYRLGTRYLEGRDVRKDRDQAMSLLRRSASAGHAAASVLVRRQESGG